MGSSALFSLPILRPGLTSPFASDQARLEELITSLTDRRAESVNITSSLDTLDQKLLSVALTNAKEEAKRQEHQNQTSILEKIAKALHLPTLPLRIECVDVSHTQGKETRVAMVVYEQAKPNVSQWRVYKMPDSADDYATLHNWVTRRIQSGSPWPDLLLIDGGKGQLNAVQHGLTSNDHADLFPLAAIAKARDEQGKADRRAGNVADRIFLPNRTNPLPIKEGSSELLFLQQIRDATHHFAITKHRQALRKAALKSTLQNLPGIGPATAKLLWDKYTSLSSMKQATIEELLTLPRIGKTKAQNLLTKLRNLPD